MYQVRNNRLVLDHPPLVKINAKIAPSEVDTVIQCANPKCPRHHRAIPFSRLEKGHRDCPQCHGPIEAKHVSKKRN